MIQMRFDVRGLDAIQRVNALRKLRAEDTRELMKLFHARIKDRIWEQYQHSGVVSGPYGTGSYKWARNKPSTVAKKGFNKPMFSSRGPYGTSLMKSYKFRAWHQRRPGNSAAMATVTLTNDKFYADYLHNGNENMEPRWCQGFIYGDTRWLMETAADRALDVRGR